MRRRAVERGRCAHWLHVLQARCARSRGLGLLCLRVGLAFGMLALNLSCTLPAPVTVAPGLRPGLNGEFGVPVAVQILGYSDVAPSDDESVRDVMEPFLTRDGKYLFFNNSNDPSVDTNLHWAQRIDDVTFAYMGEVPGVNTTQLEGTPSVDADGTLYFVSPRSYGRSLGTIYRARWQGSVAEIDLVPGVSERVPGIVNFDVEVSADGNELIFVVGEFRRGDWLPRTADLLHAYRQGDAFVRDPRSAQIFAAVNTDALEYAAALGSDGLELFFTRADVRRGVPPGIFRATRSSRTAPFSAGERVLAVHGEVEGPALSSDDRTLYFHRRGARGFSLYCVQRNHRTGGQSVGKLGGLSFSGS